jgi:hypothetical protein
MHMYVPIPETNVAHMHVPMLKTNVATPKLIVNFVKKISTTSLNKAQTII